VLAVARAPSAEMLAADPALSRLEFWGRMLRFPVFASLAVVATAIVLTLVEGPDWLLLLLAGGLLWLGFAQIAIRVWRQIHLSDLAWRLDHAPQRERTMLTLAQRATWNWSDEIPDDATHAVLVVGEIGGELQVEEFCDWETAKARLDQRVDLLSREREPVVVGLVELDPGDEPALIAVEAGRIGERRPLESLPLAGDGWLVGI